LKKKRAGLWNYNLKYFLIAAFFLYSCASAPVFQERWDTPADITGIVHAGKTNTLEEYVLLDRLGASWILATFYWSGIEPSENQWDFDNYDLFVNTAKTAGKKIIGVLAYEAPWIYSEGKARKYIPPDKLGLFLNYVRQTTAHFRGRVDAWCIWNEPNTSRFWDGSHEDFFLLTSKALNAAREADPDVTLLGGAVNRGIFGLPKKFIKGLFESGAMEKADAFAFHPYEINPERTLSLYNQFKKIATAYGFGEKIWVTEVGYPTGGWYPTKVSEKKFPEYIVKTFVNLAAAGAQKILWYQLFDPPVRDNVNSEDFFGLVRSKADYTSKGAEAFRLCAQYLSGAGCYIPEIEEGLPKTLRAFYFERSESGALVLWNEGFGSRQIRLQLPGYNHVSHDLVSGIASPVPVEMSVKAGKTPVFITWLTSGEEKPVIKKN
jgi:hypothetical protein